MASETITRNDLTEILNAVLPAVGFTQTELLKRKQITANSTHTLNDDISNYDAFVITMHNASSAGSGQSTFITKAQLASDPTTVVAPIHFGTQYAIAGITSLSGTTLKIGFLNVSSVSPYMSIIGLKWR